MPEYLAPGVFVEEVSFRDKSIEGVSTSTAGFVGPCRFGPVGGEPEILTSFADFERIYGGLDAIEFHADTGPRLNYLAQAVRHFFDEGGRRLYVARAFDDDADLTTERFGVATWAAPTSLDPLLEVHARHPGSAGNRQLILEFDLSDDLAQGGSLTGIRPGDVLWIEASSGSVGSPPLVAVERNPDGSLSLSDGSGTVDLATIQSVRRLSVSVVVGAAGRFDSPEQWADLGFHADPTPGRPASLFTVFDENPPGKTTRLFVPIVFAASTPHDSLAVARALLGETSIAGDDDVGSALALLVEPASLPSAPPSASARSLSIVLQGGHDGERCSATAYQGPPGADEKSGLQAFETVEDISIVAAPGHSEIVATDTDKQQVVLALIQHCEQMRYRAAVLDAPKGATVSEASEFRARIDTTRAAVYYPWVRAFDPVSEREIIAPPSGFLAGIWARNDVEFGVHHSPANTVIRQALGFETLINKAQQEVLNPKGINVLRFFEGRGFRVWGARTASSDSEWKYINVRRYFMFLERSIELATQFAVFENNGPVLWANIRSTVEAFLFNEWRSNHLLGAKPQQAYFVRCDRTTMTQNDLDNGRLVCLIGVSPLRPAEFVIFRIGQKTASTPN